MRTLLLILTLSGLLAACSDNGGGKPDKADPDSAPSAESAQMQDQTESGKKESATPDLEAGQPVTKPSPPEPDSSGDAEETGDGSEAKNAQGSGDAVPAESSDEAAGADQTASESQARAASKIYDRYCVACHEKGMAGAPKLSNTTEWQKRLDKRGLKGLASNSWDGYRAMPAKGTCSSCSREELEATVEWMLDQSGVSF